MFNICKIIIIFLALYRTTCASSSDELCSEVRRVQALGQNLETIEKLNDAARIASEIRRKIGGASNPRFANNEESKAIIRSIAQAEVTMMLVDGAYNFHFIPDYSPNNFCSLSQQVHRTIVFAIARATQILVENQRSTNEDIATLIGRDLNSQHMPSWMKQIYGTSNIKGFNYRQELLEYTDIEKFSLAGERLREREQEQRDKPRLKFEIDLTEENKRKSEVSHSSKGLPFVAEAFAIGKHTFEAFAIKPDGACAFYGCQGPHGYFGRKDFGEQILGNIDTDPVLEQLTRHSVTYDPQVHERLETFPDIRSGLPTSEVMDSFYHTVTREAKKGREFTDENTQEILDEIDRVRPIYFNEQIKPQYEKILTLENLKKIVGYETDKSIFMTAFQSYITYMDLMAHLNNINIYAFPSCDNAIVFEGPRSHVSHKTARNIFLLFNLTHVTRLVPAENRIENLVEWIKAKAHEEKRRTYIDEAYKRAWMAN